MSFVIDMPGRSLTSPLEPRVGTLCISPEGELLVPGTAPFYERIGYRNPDFDAGDYAVRNMGFVAISRLSRDRLRIRLRPDLVTGQAVEEVCRYLAERSLEEIELDYLDDEWKREIWPNDPALLHRLVMLCAATKPAERVTFHAEPITVSDAVEDHGNPFKPLIQKWRVSFGQFNETTLPFLQRFGFFPKLVILTRAGPGEPLRFSFIGSGVQVYDEATMGELIGRPVTDQPDRAYGEWVGSQYAAFLESERPRLDCIEARVRHSSDQVRSVRYERLLLPWRSASGSQLITCASVLLAEERTTVANENSPVGPTVTGERSGSSGIGGWGQAPT